MKQFSLKATALLSLLLATPSTGLADYMPSPENIEARQRFTDDRFGIFIHWGIYSMFAQGEWYLNEGVNAEEYAKAARGFYPADFNAAEWVAAIKNSGARYITITTRHHDGFSMFDTAQSTFDIVDATPFGRDIIKELADECARQDITLNFYYSHLDWTNPTYPTGWTGTQTGRDPKHFDRTAYCNFMNAQLTELLTNYGPIGAIWFDGMWDHDPDKEDFNWNLTDQYALIHSLQPACLIGNNHHKKAYPGEDFQIFECDLPGENTAGFSGNQEISPMPLETCNTINGFWGYHVKGTDYKSVDELIRYLVNTAGLGANLLLNIGPQPNGALPDAALQRLEGIGKWLGKYGETIYGTSAYLDGKRPWGTVTRKDNRLFVHLMDRNTKDIEIPLKGKIRKAEIYDTAIPVRYTAGKTSVTLHLDSIPEGPDHIITLHLKK